MNHFVNGFSPISFAGFLSIITLLLGGVACAGRWLSVRVLVGTWCLACFILITAYSSVLISFVISPNLKPVITSVYDIPKVHGLQVLIENNSTFHKVLNIYNKEKIF